MMRFIPAILLLSLLCACGQVGDLYLPTEKASSAEPPPLEAEENKLKKK